LSKWHQPANHALYVRWSLWYHDL